MPGANTELGVAYLSLLPSMQGFAGTAKRELGGQGQRLGADFGNDFGRAMVRSAGPDIAKIKRELTSARNAEADSAGKVRVAEAKLQDVRSKGKATAAQLATAEENLASAKRKAASATDRTTTAAKKHAEAEEDLKKDLGNTEQALDRTRGASRRLEAQHKDTGEQSRKSGRLMKGAVAGLAGGVVGVGAAVAGIGLTSFFKDATGAASDLQEASTKVVAIFGEDGAKALNDFAAGSAEKLGQTKQQVLDAASSFGTFGKAAGLSGTDLVKFSTDFNGLSTDMASFFNTSPDEAMEAIASGLRGEAEPLRKYGVLLDDASLRQEALSQGLIETTKEALTPQNKVLAAQGLIMKQTKDAQGDFARTSGGLANQQRIAAAQGKELRLQIGSFLLPALTKGYKLLNTYVIPQVSKFVTGMKEGTGAGGRFAGGVKKLWEGFEAGVAFVKPVAGDIARFIKSLVDGGGTASGFVKTITGVFRDNFPFIKETVKDVFGSVKSIVVDVMAIVGAQVKFWTGVAKFIWKNFGSNIINVAVGFYKSIIGTVRGLFKIISGVVKVVSGVMTGDWDKAGEGFKDIARGVKKVVVSVFKGAMTGVEEAVKAGVKAVGLAWDKVQGLVDKPVKFIVNTILEDGILKAFRSISKAVGFDAGANLHVAYGGNGGGSKSTARNGAQSSGGGYDRGGWTGPGRTLDPAGIVHADEFVVKKSSRRKFEAEHPGYLEHLNRYGRLPGYFLGGGVTPASGRIVPHGLPYYGARWAGDLQGSYGSPVRSYEDGQVSAVRRWNYSYGNHIKVNHPGNINTLYAHLSQIGVSPGQKVGRGEQIGRIGSTGNSSGPHLHFELRGGSGILEKIGQGAGAVAEVVRDFVGDLKDKFKGPLGRLAEVGNSPFGQMMKAIPTKLKDSMITKIKGLSEGLGANLNPAGASVARWAPLVRQALGMTGLPMSLEDNWLRQIQSESGGNPRAVQGNIGDINNRTGDLAKGLVQVIGATFARYRDPKLPNDRFNPLSSLVAGMRYAKARYGNLEGVIGHGHGYARGTMNARPGWAWVGEEGPELMRMRGGEQVMPHAQSMQYTGGQTTVNLVSTGNTHNDLAEVNFEFRRNDRGGVYAGR